LNEIKEVLAAMGLHLGMEVANWPPDNIEELAKRFQEPY
jgi:DNA-directed RNA polymerase subunit alpha